MNILLCKFNNIIDNFNLSSCYQDYFIFEIKDNNTFLYLNPKILKQYLKDGINIKYRKNIFSFLKNIKINNNIFYKISNFNEKINIDKNNFIDCDTENLEFIINLSNKIIKNKNKFTIIDKNIVKLDTNFYADINLSRFLYSKKEKIYKFNGIIINHNKIKNRILSLQSIWYYNKNHKYLINGQKTKDKLQFNTKCILILSEMNEINSWIETIEQYIPNKKIHILKSKKDMKILNKEIFNLDFLIINIHFLYNKYFKNYFYKYIDDEIDKYSNISILNSLYDNLYNKNIENENLNNLYLFKWNMIIFDDINKIKILDKKNYINYFASNLKYYLLNNDIDNSISNYIIKNSIIDNNNNDLDIFYIFLKKELLINNKKKLNIDYIFVNLEMSSNELDIFNNLFEDNKDVKKMSLFFINSEKYNFNKKSFDEIYEINEKYYNSLIEKDNNKINNIQNFFKDKKEDENYNNYINKYFDTNLFFEETESSINLLIKNITNNINLYKLKIAYFKNIINEFDKKDYSCSICLDNIEKNNFSIINCGHYFCKDCLRKYINLKKKFYECPNCRCNFTINDIFVPNINKDDDNKIVGTKMKKIKEIVNSNNKIIIVTHFKENIKIKDFINDDTIFFNLFYKNNFLKEKNKNLFINEKNKSVLFSNYDDMLLYNFNNVDTIIFIDYIDINNNIFLQIKNNYLEKYVCDSNNITFYFLYMNNTFEETIINKYIK